jgi:hypothetical protein
VGEEKRRKEREIIPSAFLRASFKLVCILFVFNV